MYYFLYYILKSKDLKSFERCKINTTAVLFIFIDYQTKTKKKIKDPVCLYFVMLPIIFNLI